MKPVIIFIPCFLYNQSAGLLYGIVREIEEVRSYFILGICDVLNRTLKLKNTRCSAIGYYCKDRLPSKELITHKQDWLILGLKQHDFVIHKLFNSVDDISTRKCRQTVCIIYDHRNFLESQFLLENTEFDGSFNKDHFKTLTKSLKDDSCFHDISNSFIFRNSFMQTTLIALLSVVNALLYCMNKMYPLLKYSTLGLHLQIFLKSIAWVLQSSITGKKISVKVGNYAVALVVDVIIGMMLLYWIMAVTTSPSQLLLDTGEVMTISKYYSDIKLLISSPLVFLISTFCTLKAFGRHFTVGKGESVTHFLFLHHF